MKMYDHFVYTSKVCQSCIHENLWLVVVRDWNGKEFYKAGSCISAESKFELFCFLPVSHLLRMWAQNDHKSFPWLSACYCVFSLGKCCCFTSLVKEPDLLQGLTMKNKHFIDICTGLLLNFELVVHPTYCMTHEFNFYVWWRIQSFSIIHLQMLNLDAKVLDGTSIPSLSGWLHKILFSSLPESQY